MAKHAKRILGSFMSLALALPAATVITFSMPDMAQANNGKGKGASQSQSASGSRGNSANAPGRDKADTTSSNRGNGRSNDQGNRGNASNNGNGNTRGNNANANSGGNGDANANQGNGGQRQGNPRPRNDNGNNSAGNGQGKGQSQTGSSRSGNNRSPASGGALARELRGNAGSLQGGGAAGVLSRYQSAIVQVQSQRAAAKEKTDLYRAVAAMGEARFKQLNPTLDYQNTLVAMQMDANNASMALGSAEASYDVALSAVTGGRPISRAALAELNALVGF